MYTGITYRNAWMGVTFLIGGVIVLLAPSLASADLVTCEGAGCRTCDVVYTANGVISWLVGIMASLCTLVVLYSGAQMVMAAGNVGRIESAKGHIWNALIGFFILLVAWLLVDTILKILVVGNDQTSSTEAARLPGLGPWNEVICSESPIATPLGPPATVESGGGITTGTLSCGQIGPLSPMTDTLSVEMENGRSLIWDNTDPRLRVCAQKMGGTITSAYRPQPYQSHLYEIWNKWCNQGLRNNTDPSCSALKTEVQSELSKHGLSCDNLVAQSASSHGQGIAVDISGAPQTSANCLSWFGPRDKVHYTLQSGCSCN